MKRPWFLQKIV